MDGITGQISARDGGFAGILHTTGELNSERSGRAARTATIFIAEDCEGDLLLLRKALRENRVSAELLVARDGDEAIRIVDRIDATELPCPDLIVCDLNLPKRDGFDILQRARRSEKCGQLPTVILTSSDREEDRQKAASLGVFCYLLKPMDLDAYLSIGGTLKALLPMSGTAQRLMRQGRGQGQRRSK